MTMMKGFSSLLIWQLNTLILFVCFLLTGCVVPMGDSYIFVEGKIKTNNNIPMDDCKLKFFFAKDDALVQEKDIGLEFKTSLIINPYYKGDYYIKIQCGEYLFITEQLDIRGNNYYDSPLNLGVIELTHKKATK